MYLCYFDGVRIYLIQIDKLISHLDIKNLVFRCYYLVNIFLFYMEKKRETITGFPILNSRVPCACVISVFSFLNFHRHVFLFHYRIPTYCTRCWYFKTNNRSYTIVHTTIRMIRYKDGEIKVSHIICMSILSFMLLFRCPFTKLLKSLFELLFFHFLFCCGRNRGCFDGTDLYTREVSSI